MVHLTPSAVHAEVQPEASDDDRRGSGRRARSRDRLMDRASSPYAPNPAFSKIRHVENLLMFIDDDLRETALSMERIERYLVSTLEMLESDRLLPAQVQRLATDDEVLEHIDQLNDGLESLRRRVSRLARLL